VAHQSRNFEHPHFGDSTGELSCNFLSFYPFEADLRSLGATTMPPKKSTKQNSVANSHVEAQSHGHSHTMGETHALDSRHIGGGENPFCGGHDLGGQETLVGGPQQMALMFEMIKGMQ
jgi:hypothetical protein